MHLIFAYLLLTTLPEWCLDRALPPKESTCHCPLKRAEISWENKSCKNSTSVVRNGRLYMIYEAECTDDSYTRLGLAFSLDGQNFVRHPVPILFPHRNDPKSFKNPHLFETENGKYVMTYVHEDQLSVATSDNLIHWKKRGPILSKDARVGIIVTELKEDHLIATKIDDKYWMYWADEELHLATSTNLIHWTPIQLGIALDPGPIALLEEEGIYLFYFDEDGVNKALFSINDPKELVEK